MLAFIVKGFYNNNIIDKTTKWTINIMYRKHRDRPL